MKPRPSTAVLPVELLLSAYREGIFPMAQEDGELHWHCPDPRAVFDLVDLVPDRTTARVLRSGKFSTTIDRAFEQVITACADRENTWLDQRLIRSYVELHRAGHAHSVEVWRGDELAGGLYGAAIGAAFFGESMFGMANAGKVAFYTLAAHLREHGFALFDTQYANEFTASLGAKEIPRSEFMKTLETAIKMPANFQ